MKVVGKFKSDLVCEELNRQQLYFFTTTVMIQSKTSKDFEQCDKSSVES